MNGKRQSDLEKHLLLIGGLILGAGAGAVATGATIKAYEVAKAWWERRDDEDEEEAPKA